MQGPSHLDLAKTLADERLNHDRDYFDAAPKTRRVNRLRQWAGHHLIDIGERLATRPTELQLKVSTGPPCP